MIVGKSGDPKAWCPFAPVPRFSDLTRDGVTGCIGSRCMVFRTLPDDGERGYCGLAPQPVDTGSGVLLSPERAGAAAAPSSA